MNKKVLIIALLGLVLFSGVSIAKETLTIMTWPQYYSPELVEGFEKDFDVNIECIEIDSYEKMHTEIDKNPGNVDLIIFGRATLPELIKENKVKPLDKSLIPNMKNADLMFLGLKHDPESKYSLPYHYLLFGLAYNQDKLSEEEVTLKNYFEPNDKLKGKIVTFPDPQIMTGFAMKYMGKSFNSREESDLKYAKALLGNLKKHGTENADSLDRGTYQPVFTIDEGKGDMAIWYYQIGNLAEMGMDVTVNYGFKIPSEGSMFDMDFFYVPTGSENDKLAHKFVNYFYDPKNAAKSVEFLNYPVAVKGVKDYLEPEFANKVYLPVDLLKKCEIPDILSLEEEEMYKNLWQKAFK